MHDNDPEVRPLQPFAPDARPNSFIVDLGARETKKLVQHPT